MKCQNDNTSYGLGRGRLVSSSNKGSEFRYTVARQFSSGDERIGEVIQVPDSFFFFFFFFLGGGGAFLIGILTCITNLIGH